ncbi:thymidine kinase [Curvivirga sp.]|uniref:thymidine kinase n=1 Tax=Curvivirga sp. TaxID=2856848 RepID=UPI003B5C9AB5
MAKLHFYFSAMNAGKSTILLQSSYNYQERGMNTLIFTAALDDRYGIGKVTSRIGLEADAVIFKTVDDLLSITKERHSDTPLSCVLVDEAQFLTRQQVLQLSDVADHMGIPVICYGLRTDFQGQLFPGSEALLGLADEMREVKTICHCGSKATMVVRYDDKGNPVKAGDQVEIGGNDRYVSMCRKHWKETLGI